MRLEPQAMAWSAGGVTFAALGACAAFVAALPALSERLYGLVMHLDMEGRIQPVTMATWGVGVLGTSLAMAVLGWAFASLYNRLAARSAPA